MSKHPIREWPGLKQRPIAPANSEKALPSGEGFRPASSFPRVPAPSQSVTLKCNWKGASRAPLSFGAPGDKSPPPWGGFGRGSSKPASSFSSRTRAIAKCHFENASGKAFLKPRYSSELPVTKALPSGEGLGGGSYHRISTPCRVAQPKNSREAEEKPSPLGRVWEGVS